VAACRKRVALRHAHESIFRENHLLAQHAVQGTAEGTLMILHVETPADPDREEGACHVVADLPARHAFTDGYDFALRHRTRHTIWLEALRHGRHQRVAVVEGLPLSIAPAPRQRRASVRVAPSVPGSPAGLAAELPLFHHEAYAAGGRTVAESSTCSLDSAGGCVLLAKSRSSVLLRCAP